jgi:type VI secretion system ImpM family protein
MTADSAATVPGFFGKLPTFGDFVGRGWSGTLRDRLDSLIQEAITALAQLSPGREPLLQWPDLVISTRPGVLGDRALLLVLIPSLDRVGRAFPLCAGVQWATADDTATDWPPLGYARQLLANLRRALEVESEPDDLLAAVTSAGDPLSYHPTAFEMDRDVTIPRLGSNVNLLHICGPLPSMAPALSALCSVLPAACDLLGARLDADGQASDFFAARRLPSGMPLASAFDGRWVERGWSSYGAAPSPSEDTVHGGPIVAKTDDDATVPGQAVIDSRAIGPDSGTDTDSGRGGPCS